MSRLPTVTAIELERVRIVSTDVFDTLLLRDLSPEHVRDREICVEASRRLEAEGRTVDPLALLATRRQVYGTAYKHLRTFDPAGDVPVRELAGRIATVLHLDERAAACLVEAEIQVETRRLRENRRIRHWLSELGRRGKRLIATSDTHLSAADVARLLGELAPALRLDRIYTSGDLGKTKRGGRLFPIVLRSEGVGPGDLLHIGDTASADVGPCRAVGCRAVHLQRPFHLKLARRLCRLAP